MSLPDPKEFEYSLGVSGGSASARLFCFLGMLFISKSEVYFKTFSLRRDLRCAIQVHFFDCQVLQGGPVVEVRSRMNFYRVLDRLTSVVSRRHERKVMK